MNTNDTCSEHTSTSATKKPYEKPSFRYEQVFVTTALSCGKTATEGTCLHVQSAS